MSTRILKEPRVGKKGAEAADRGRERPTRGSRWPRLPGLTPVPPARRVRAGVHCHLPRRRRVDQAAALVLGLGPLISHRLVVTGASPVGFAHEPAPLSPRSGRKRAVSWAKRKAVAGVTA